MIQANYSLTTKKLTYRCSNILLSDVRCLFSKTHAAEAVFSHRNCTRRYSRVREEEANPSRFSSSVFPDPNSAKHRAINWRHSGPSQAFPFDDQRPIGILKRYVYSFTSSTRCYSTSNKSNPITASADSPNPMEVEIKLRLPDQDAYNRVGEALRSHHRGGFEQENLFFDGPNRELNAERVVLRLRLYDGNQKAVVTLKGKQILVNGVGRASEVEEEVPIEAALRFREDPSLMLTEIPLVVENVKDRFQLSALKSLGGFFNRRDEYAWEGLVLEVDETKFEHGTLYEIECETEKPEEVKGKLQSFLEEMGIPHRYSTSSKFANFVKKTLD